MELNAISIEPWFAADGCDLAFIGDSSYPLQRFPQNEALLLQLKLVRRMLVMAAAARSEVFAAGRDAFGGRSHNLRLNASQQACFHALRLYRDGFAGQHERRQQDLPVQPSQPFPAVDQVFDLYGGA